MKLPVTAAFGIGLLVASASSGFAQTSHPYRYDAQPPAYAAPRTVGETPPWVAETKPAHPPGSLVGAQVVDFKGKPVGHVTRVVGDQVVVRFDDYLEMPTATGVFPWQQLDTAYGDVALLTTTLSKGQMEGLPSQPN